MLIYEIIKKLCREKGISIRSVEVSAGLGNGAISRWKTSSPTVDNLGSVAKVLNKPIEYFLEADGSKQSVPM